MTPEGYKPTNEELLKAEDSMSRSQLEATRERMQNYEKVIDKETLSEDVDLTLSFEETGEKIHGKIRGHSIKMEVKGDVVLVEIDGKEVKDTKITKQLWNKYRPAAVQVTFDKESIDKMTSPEGIALDLLG